MTDPAGADTTDLAHTSHDLLHLCLAITASLLVIAFAGAQLEPRRHRPGGSDRMYLEMMIEHHEGAITMAEDVLNRGTNAAVQDLAQEIIDTQQAEIDYMRGVLGQD